MGQRFYLLLELLYGAVLLTAIAARPDIVINLRLGKGKAFSFFEYPEIWISYDFPDLWMTMIKALLASVLAMMPTVMMLPERLTQWRFFKFVPLAPWTVLCIVKFTQHVNRHIFTIQNAAPYMHTFPLNMVLVIYIVFFLMAMELAWHWLTYAEMCIAGYVMMKNGHIY